MTPSANPQAPFSCPLLYLICKTLYVFDNGFIWTAGRLAERRDSLADLTGQRSGQRDNRPHGRVRVCTSGGANYLRRMASNIVPVYLSKVLDAYLDAEIAFALLSNEKLSRPGMLRELAFVPMRRKFGLAGTLLIALEADPPEWLSLNTLHSDVYQITYTHGTTLDMVSATMAYLLTTSDVVRDERTGMYAATRAIATGAVPATPGEDA